MVKVAFFDIDGTLVSFDTHLMPASTKATLVELRRRGVLCCIASGRSRYQFPPCIDSGFEGFSGFDAYVSMTGSRCFDERGVYFDCPIPPTDVATIVSQVDAGRYEVLVLEGEQSYVSGRTSAIREIEQRVGLTYVEGDVHNALESRVYQFCAFLPPGEEHSITDACEGVITTRWNDLFCDIVPVASSKPAGIRATLERHGISADEAVAFGDGGNDETMLKMCGIGVAMGNAKPGTKAVADYVTADVDHDGIAEACRRLGLI